MSNKLIQYKPSAEQILNFENQLSTAFIDTFDSTENEYQDVATIIPMDERGMVFGWLTQDDDLEEFDPVTGRVVKALAAHGARIEVRKYTKTVAVSFDDIRDGKFSSAVISAKGVGNSAKRHPDRLVFGVLKDNSVCLYDGQPLFAANHLVKADDTSMMPATFSNEDMSGSGPTWYLQKKGSHSVLFGVRSGEGYSFGTLDANSEQAFMKEQIVFGVRTRVVAAGGLPQFCYRSNQPLTPVHLEAAVAAMEAFVGPEGQPINNSPTQLLVPKKLRAAAKRLVKGDRNDKGGFNEWFEEFDLKISAYL